ncbi:hypothetical protein ACQUW5_08575 [Legionella sp. CNM-1927-20]|uniref:hypothetical protein n=1 Tax=Legionella sp. CNM-1927-20 TaxID=3422221 RepID=UPI00403AD027
MNRTSIVAYMGLIDIQKNKYIQSIKQEMRELRVMAAVKLAKVTGDDDLRDRLLIMAYGYQQDPSDVNLKSLNGAIKAAKDNGFTRIDTPMGEQARAAVDVVQRLDGEVDQFSDATRVNHRPLSEFIKTTQEIVDNTAPLFQMGSGIRETLARIVNKIVSVVAKSKPFDERNEAERKIDRLKTVVDSSHSRFFGGQPKPEKKTGNSPEKVSQVTLRS